MEFAAMSTQLAEFIADVKVIDTHEHLCAERAWTDDGPADVLQDLFGNYVYGDLLSAGATPEAVERVTKGSHADIATRWSGIERAWDAIRHTGYAEAVRLCARHVYGMEAITPEALQAAQPTLEALRKPGQRLHLLRDRAKLDHVQTDNSQRVCVPDASGPDFFMTDISWVGFTVRGVDWALLAEETGVTVKDLASLRRAMEEVFERYGPHAIAVKTQHAYQRTLRWEPRADADAERALQATLRDGDAVDETARLLLGDWCLARGAELAGAHGLPVKIHTGYYAGNDAMVTDRIRAGHLCPLLIAYPGTRFVLMHAAWPYGEELIALAKHFRNVWADLCWAWSINPAASRRFVRRFAHAAPASKLFAFGGDTAWPTSAYAYALQMRRHLARALQAEVAAGDMTEAEAIDFARRVLHENQMNCFDVAGTRAANAGPPAAGA